MNNIGTLKLLIEADSVGLTSQLKRASNTIVNFVGQMNKQEVNWTSILSRSISPAIIAGIASTFALAIGEALNFQNTMSNVATGSSDAFANNLGDAGKSVLDLSSKTGISMSDMASASSLLSHYIDVNSEAFKSFSEEVGNFAYSAGLNYKDLLTSTLPTMKDWGISAENMSSSINDMVSASQNGVIPLDELSQILGKTADGLRGLISLKDVAYYLEKLSSIIPKDDASKIIEAIGKAAADALDPLNLLLGGPDWVGATLKAKGMQGVLDGIVKVTGQGTIVSQQLAKAMGVSPETAKTISDYKDKIVLLHTEVDKAEKAETTLKEKTEALTTPTKELGKAWNALLVDISKLGGGAGTAVVNWLTNMLKGIDALFHPLETLKGYFDELKDGFKNLSTGNIKESGIFNTITSPLSGFSSSNMGLLSNIFSGLSSLFNPKTASASGMSSNVVTNNYVNNNNFNSSTMGSSGQVTPYSSEYLKTQGYHF